MGCYCQNSPLLTILLTSVSTALHLNPKYISADLTNRPSLSSIDVSVTKQPQNSIAIITHIGVWLFAWPNYSTKTNWKIVNWSLLSATTSLLLSCCDRLIQMFKVGQLLCPLFSCSIVWYKTRWTIGRLQQVTKQEMIWNNWYLKTSKNIFCKISDPKQKTFFRYRSDVMIVMVISFCTKLCATGR